MEDWCTPSLDISGGCVSVNFILSHYNNTIFYTLRNIKVSTLTNCTYGLYILVQERFMYSLY